jgi:soluble lytic murein transglycosylase-like protein
MSTQAITGAAPSGIPAGELAAAARVRELQQMIEKTRGVSTATTPATRAGAVGSTGSATAFAAALQAAGAQGLGASSPLSSGSSPYDALIEQAAQRNGVDPAILHGLIQQESGFDPNSRSGAGASGLTQLMPGTASSLGVANPLNPAESIEGGARYLSQMMAKFGGNTSDALAAYNAGPGAVSRYGGVPPYAETQSYVTKVLGYAEGYRREHPTTATGSIT